MSINLLRYFQFRNMKIPSIISSNINLIQSATKILPPKIQAMIKDKIRQALDLAGSQHRYQKILILLIALSWVEFNFAIIGSTYIYMNPVFYCNNNFDQKVFQSQACPQIQNCELIDKFTLTAELELYCGNEWARDVIQSVFTVGAMIGLFVMNLISDTKGRKIATVISLVFMCAGILIGIIGGLAKQIPLSILSQFVQGIGTSSLISLSYAFLSDYCSPNLKPRGVIIVNTAWSISTVLLGVFYLIQVNWWIFLLIIMFIPLIGVSILMHLFLHESPYIYMLRNKRQQTFEVLHKVAIINNMTHNMQKIKEIIDSTSEDAQQSQTNVKNVFKVLREWVYFKPLIVLSVIRLIGSLNFIGISYAFDVQGLGLGWNSIIAGVMELVSYVFLTFYVNRIPRRTGIAGFYSICILLGLLFFIPAIKNSLIVGTCLMGITRIFSTTSYTLIASMQTQAFTVEIQSTAVGITQAFGLFGALGGPLMVDLADKIGVDPVALIAIFLNFAVWPTAFVKQTLNSHLKKEEIQPLLKDQIEQNSFKDSLLSQSTIITNQEGQS